jgi:rhomboid protease GluP
MHHPLPRAPVTRALLALNVLVFCVELLSAGPKGFLSSFPQSVLLELGASYPPATLGENRWETLVTACFLHGGVLHVGLNMLALWYAGPIVEAAVGAGRMASMYLAAGAFGNLLSVVYGRLTRVALPSVGASGAIAGVIGAAMVVGWRVQGWRGPLTQAMARWLAFLAVFGVMSNLSGVAVDNAAHLGGALAGAFIALAWRRGVRHSQAADHAVLAACAVVLVACIAVVSWHDRTDRFAAMTLRDRRDYTQRALDTDHCREAFEGLAAVQRLRAWAPARSLSQEVEASCGTFPLQ